MKKLIPVLALLALLACNNKSETKTETKDTAAAEVKADPQVPDRSLVGKWHPVQVDVARMNEDEKKQLIDSATIEFTSDGRIVTQMKSTTRTGTYMFSEQDSKLMTKIEDKDEKFDIAWENGLLKMTNEEGTVTMRRE